MTAALAARLTTLDRRTLVLLLAAYGIVLAVGAGAWWSSRLPVSDVSLQGSRVTLLSRSIAVLDQGGPPLLASPVPYARGLKHPEVFYPANGGDDEGVYLYLPVLGHLTGDRNPASLEKWLAVGGMALVVAAFPLLVYALFASVPAAVVTPLVLVRGLEPLINTDIYWVTAWILLLGLPIVCVAALHRWRRSTGLALVATACVLASFATSIRVNSGLVVALTALTVAVVRERSWGGRALVAAVAVVSYLSIATIGFGAVRAYRDHVSHMPPSSVPTAHAIWHATFLGLGYLPNPWGIRWDDAYGVSAARKVDPNVVYLTPHYEHIIRHLYFEHVREAPRWVAHLYLVKLASLVRDVFNHDKWGFLVLPFLAAVGPRRRTLRRAALLSLPAVAVAFVPALAGIPSFYDQGVLGGALLLALLALAAGIAAVAELLVRWRGGERHVGPPSRATKRALTVAAAVTVAGAGAAFGAVKLAAANDDAAYYTLGASSPAAAPRTATTIRRWRGPHDFGDWVAAGGAAVSHGVVSATAIGLPAFSSPPLHLRAGRYAVHASERLTAGAMALRVVTVPGDVELGKGLYWHGQSGLARPGVLVEFELRAARDVRIETAQWARVAPQSSAWSLSSVELLRER